MNDEQQQPDPRDGLYYVTVRRDDGEWRILRGPFLTHVAALAALPWARRRACELDPKAHWYSYGTARSLDHLGVGILDKL